MRRLLLLGTLGLAFVGCGASNAELAKDSFQAGDPCNAATLEPRNTTYSHDCMVEHEEHEAEAVIKHRHAEELANAAEGR